MSQSSRSLLFAIVLLIIALMASIGLVIATQPEQVDFVLNPPLPTATAAPTQTPQPIQVYVTGAVNQPETTVTIAHQSRIETAIAAAGGFTESADLTAINLAGILRDGDHVHVPEKSAETANPFPTPLNATTIYINSATLDEIMTLPGIGETIATRILDYRQTNGRFMSHDDLKQVSGIGDGLIERIQDQISYE